MRLFIRTEASAQIGMGHFMRCFAIAEEAQGIGIPVTFLLNEIGTSVQARLEEIGASSQLLLTQIGSVYDLDNVDLTFEDWLIVDSYKMDADYLAAAHRRAHLAVIDDLNSLPYFDCDILINTAMSVRAQAYNEKTKASLLIGAGYALIREEFCTLRNEAEGKPFISIMFGGSDPTQLTGICARLLHDLFPDINIRLIVGPANLYVEDLKRLQLYERIKVFISPQSVAEVLFGSDLVITAAGGSVGEIACMGLPALVLVVVDNQVAALDACPYPVIDARAGLPDDFSTTVAELMRDTERRLRIGHCARHIVDGEGPVRILRAMRDV